MGGAATSGIGFAIQDWAAYAPGLSEAGAWRAWARAPHAFAGSVDAPLADMAPLLRRRLAGVGRMAAQAAWDAQPQPGSMPVVFASRWGDAQRSLQLLTAYCQTGELSPTDFALSVHNAIGALYSIARRDGRPYCSIAGESASAAAGLIEAAAWLADGAPEVLLVCYDAPLPGEYAEFDEESPSCYAWAWRITSPVSGRSHFRLAWDPVPAAAAPDETQRPFAVDALRFVLSGEAAAVRDCAGRRWLWSRHDA